MGLVHGHVVRASIGWLVGSEMDAEEVGAREHEVSQDKLADGKEGRY